MKRLAVVLAVFLMVALAAPAFAADVKIHGDFNNRFMVYTNHADWFNPEQDGRLDDGDVEETWGEAKYRMWFDAATNDGKVKGVWAMEIGSLEYGLAGDGKGRGGSYSGDTVNIETRWLYTDFQLPWIENKARVRMGLQPLDVNSFFWQETIMGVVFNGGCGNVDFTLGWLRPYSDKQESEEDEDVEDLDAFYGRVNFKPMSGIEAGLFAVYFQGDDDDPTNFGMVGVDDYILKKFENNYDLELVTVGLDGKFSYDSFFGSWDFMYEDGEVDKIAGMEEHDVEAYFAHVDLGYKLNKMKFTYTFWYASGDDDPNDGDLEGFISVDVDRMDSLTIFEGGFTDDDYFSERPYLQDKGFIMNKLALDYKASKKMTLGAAAMYMLTAEDIEYTVGDKKYDDDEIGFEFNGYLKYMLYDNLEFAINAGYLIAGDAMDYYEIDSVNDIDPRDGDADEDIFLSTARVRYKF
jgi:hypothetical protein